MKLRLHTLAVLLRKDFRLMMTNKNVIIIMLLPLGFALLYQTILSEAMAEEGLNFVLTLCVLVNLAAVPLSGLSMMVAEEKEKNTLRVLMLSDVSALEYIFAKVLCVLCMMEVITIAIFLITGTAIQYLPIYLLITTLTSIAVLLFGAVIGILSKDQMSTGTLSTPLMVLFMIPPMFEGINSFMEFLANLVPTTHMNHLLNAALLNQSILQSTYLIDYGVIALWIVLGVAAFIFMYHRKGFDN